MRTAALATAPCTPLLAAPGCRPAYTAPCSPPPPHSPQYLFLQLPQCTAETHGCVLVKGLSVWDGCGGLLCAVLIHGCHVSLVCCVQTLCTLRARYVYWCRTSHPDDSLDLNRNPTLSQLPEA